MNQEACRAGYPAEGTILEKNAWVEAQQAIGHAYGSSVMEGICDWTADTTTPFTIKGADYEAALIATYNDLSMTPEEAAAMGFVLEDNNDPVCDGAHFIVAYVKDEAGNWNAAASFNA